MAGEIKLNNVSIATENAGTVTIAPNNVQFAANHAGIKAALNASGDAPIHACRAWASFQPGVFTLGPPPDYIPTTNIDLNSNYIKNISSVVSNNTGQFSVNFTNSVSYYVPFVSYLDYSGMSRLIVRFGSTSSTSCFIECTNTSGTYVDSDLIYFAIIA